MDPHLLTVARDAVGFMPDDEGLALHEAGRLAGRIGPLLEIGAYCGKSSVYLGSAARDSGTVLFSVDHHRGSEENQAGWEWHDPAVVDPATGRIDTLPHFRRTIERAGLEDVIVAVVGESATVARHWATPLGLVFVDGGHAFDVALADYEGWSPHLVPGGLLVFHDVFEDRAEGGQAPFDVWRRAVGSGGFLPLSRTGSLRVLRRAWPAVRLEVRDEVEHRRFVLLLDASAVGTADYRVEAGRMVLPHTVVAVSMRGRGLGEHLIEEVLLEARRRGLAVVPECWFVAQYLREHPEHRDLVAT